MKISPSLVASNASKVASSLLQPAQRLTARTMQDPMPGAATGGPAQALPTSIDLEQFFKAWGTDNAEFDVTKDGVVDGADLAVFLGAMEEAPNQPPAPEPPPVSAQDVLAAWGQSGGAADINGDGTVDASDLALALGNAQTTPSQALAEGVQKAWGTSNPEFDLDKNGIVDASDLAIALSGAPATAEAATPVLGAPAAPEPTATQPISDEAAKSAASMADALLSAFGGADTGELPIAQVPGAEAVLGPVGQDGVLGREELVDRLAKRLDAAIAAKPDIDVRRLANQWLQSLVSPTSTSTNDPRVAMAREAYGAGGVDRGADRMADRLHRRLAASGFERTPPANLDRLVDGLATDRATRAALLKSLAGRYPQGLGVNAKA